MMDQFNRHISIFLPQKETLQNKETNLLRSGAFAVKGKLWFQVCYIGIRILVDYITFDKMSTILFNRTSSFLQQIISGSWDNTVKFWQATPTGLKEGRRALNLKVRKENSFGVCFYTRLNQVAVLSIDILGDRVAAATYDKKVTHLPTHKTDIHQVVMLDRREGPRKCSFYKVHSKPVLAVKMSERQVG